MTMSLVLILCFRSQMPFVTNQKLTAEGAFLALLQQVLHQPLQHCSRGSSQESTAYRCI